MRNVKKEEQKNNKGSTVIIGVLFAIIFILIGFISATQREVIETWPVIGQIFAEPEPVTHCLSESRTRLCYRTILNRVSII